MMIIFHCGFGILLGMFGVTFLPYIHFGIMIPEVLLLSDQKTFSYKVFGDFTKSVFQEYFLFPTHEEMFIYMQHTTRTSWKILLLFLFCGLPLGRLSDLFQSQFFIFSYWLVTAFFVQQCINNAVFLVPFGWLILLYDEIILIFCNLFADCSFCSSMKKRKHQENPVRLVELYCQFIRITITDWRCEYKTKCSKGFKSCSNKVFVSECVHSYKQFYSSIVDFYFYKLTCDCRFCFQLNCIS